MARGVAIVTTALALGLPGAAGAAGTAAWAAVLLAALLVTVNGLGYAELAAGTPRSGGAYSLVYRASGDEVPAFITGWALMLSEIGLCAALAHATGEYLAALLAAFFETPVPLGLLASGAVVVAALGRLVRRSGRHRGKAAMAYLLGFAALFVMAVLRADPTNLHSARLDLQATLPTILVAFAGLELTTSFQRETGRKGSSLPPSMLLAPGAAGLLGAALITALVGVAGRWTTANSPAALGLIGEAIAGDWGQMAVLVLATIAALPALSQALSLVVRQLFLMSRDGFLPAWLGRVDYRRKAPIPAIALAGLIVLPVVWLPASAVSRVAGLLYLVVLISVNVALARRPRDVPQATGAAPPTFALPAHPWVPSIVVAVDLLTIALWDQQGIVYALGCLAAGGLIYLVYGRRRYERSHEGVTVFRTSDGERTGADYSVLVPIANPATAGALLRFAGHLAQANGGEVIALRVEVVPEPLPLEAGRRRGRAGHTLLDEAMALGNEENWPLRTVTRVARTVADGILTTAADENANLILTGWRGPVRTRETSLGSVLNGVLRDAPCDVLILRGEGMSLPKRILVPSAGGPHARAAARLGLLLAGSSDGVVTLLSVLSGPATEEQTEERRRLLADTVAGLDATARVEQRLVRAPSAAEGIIQEAQDHDLVLLGVSEESLLDRLVFGSVPLQVASRVQSAGLVQGSRGVAGVWTRRLVRALSSAFPVLEHGEQTQLRQDLLRGAHPGTNYLVLIVLSCIIAALGLLLSSPAVVIGAMLIAPLMSPLMAFSMGLVLGDLRLIRLSTEAILKGIAVALLIAAFVGVLSPLKGVTSEMLARSRPTLLDLGVALASGLAGAYALSREDVSSALPGVALAASLMPPLATVGLGLAMGQPRVAGGALLLFVANIAAISLAGGIVFLLLGVRPQAWAPDSRKHLRRRLIASAVMLVVIAVPLSLIFAGIVEDSRRERTAEAILDAYLSDIDAEMVGLEAKETGQNLLVIATVRSNESITIDWVDGVAAAMTDALERTVQLDVVALPVIRSESR